MIKKHRARCQGCIKMKPSPKSSSLLYALFFRVARTVCFGVEWFCVPLQQAIRRWCQSVLQSARMVAYLSLTLFFGLTSLAANAATFAPNTANQPVSGLAVSGFGASDVLLVGVSLASPPSGTTFRFGTTTGLTASFGYAFNSTLTEISFRGTPANVNAALASILLSTGATMGNFNFNVTASIYVADMYYNPANNHYYHYVSAPSILWTSAKTDAEGLTFNGATGYLVTITSAQENTFVATYADAPNIWTGASDAAVEGVWRWETGPEAGIQFWQGNGSGTVTGPYNFASWTPGEPNNSGPEHYVLTNFNGGFGLWNDGSNASSVGGYLAEFSPPYIGVFSQMLSGSVVVGGGVVGLTQSIPTLGEWAMIFMASLILMFGIRGMRHGK